MVVSTISQEIVKNVVGHLQDDSHTLKQCSTVSRSFLVPSQKRLFLTIYIGKRLLSQKLNEVLTSSSHIVPYVRRLHLLDRSPPTQELWFRDEESFVAILRTVRPYLETFTLTLEDYTHLEWAKMSADWQSSLLDLFASPKLTSIRLKNICTTHLPPGLFGGMVQLKKLGFISCCHSSESHDPPHPPIVPFPEPKLSAIQERKGQLDALEIDGDMSMGVIESLKQPNALIDISQLREITIHDATPKMLEQAWAIMQTAAKTIESFMWWDRLIDPETMYENPFRPLDLTILPKLRFLGFRIYGTEHSVQLEWIVQALTQGFIPSTLEELTIIAKDEEDDGFTIPGGINEICWTFAESGFGNFLSSGSGDYEYPNLRRVTIVIETPNEAEITAAYQKDLARLMAKRLPLLAKKGLLFAQLCGIDKVQAELSTLLTV